MSNNPVQEITFVGGIDESVHEEVLPAGTSWSTLENGRYDRKAGYRKRRGYASTAKLFLDNTSRTAGARILMNGDQLCVIDGTKLDVSADTLDVSVVKGRVPEATYRILEAPAPHLTNLVDGDGDTITVEGQGGTYVVLARRVLGYGTALTQTHSAYVCLLDAANGAVILPTTKLQEGAPGGILTVRLAAYGSRVFAFVSDQTAATVKAYILNTSSRTSINAGWSLLGTVAVDCLTSLCAASLVATSAVCIAYVNTSASTSNISVRKIDSTGTLAVVQINTSSITPSANVNAVNLSEGSSNLWVAWNENGTVKAKALNESTLAQAASTATILTGAGSSGGVMVGPRTSGNAAVYTTGSPMRMRAIAVSAGATVTAGSEATLGNAQILSRPFLRNGRNYAHFASQNYSEMILCDCTPDTSSASNLATWLRPVCAPIQREIFAGCGVRTAQIASTTKYLFGFTVRKSGSTFGAALVEYDFANPYRWKPASLNASTLLSGGVTSVFDGSRIFEANFLIRGFIPQIFSTGTSGSLTFTLGGRRYVTTFEDVDADGNWHISGVSDPSPLTGNVASMLIDLLVRPISITSRGFTTSAIHTADGASGTRVVLWGTLDGGEEPYYRLVELVNDPNAETIAYADDTSDDTLASRALLYGTGNLPGTGASQDHRAPPGLLYHVSYNGMLVGASGRTIWFSGQPIDGEGTWFSPAFTLSVDDDVTGLAVQDGSVLIFTKRSVWVTSGEPPSDNALQGGLSTPRRLAIEFGCVNANSIVTTELGTFRETERGIELVNRGQANDFIGDKIQETLAAYPVITSAALDAGDGLVRFSLAESFTDGVVSDVGRDLIYDLTLRGWVAVDVKRGGMASQASQDACMAIVDDEWRYCWLAPNGTVYYERNEDDASAHVDVTTWIAKVAETPWLHLAGLQGEQFIDQVFILAKRVTDHDLIVSLAFDYFDTYTETKTFSAATIAAELREWLVYGLTRAKHSAVRIKLEDATPSSGSVATGEGGTWIGLTLNGSAHAGPRRTPATQRGSAS